MPRPVSNVIILTPLGIDAYWDRMLPAIRKLRRISNNEWRTEDVYLALRTGTSTCYTTEGNYDGFIIANKTEDVTGRKVWIWMANAERGADVPAYWETFREILAEDGYHSIMFSSERVGWARRAAQYGFRAVKILYKYD